ncbi:hypothetical protein BDF22DRAFT_654646 [Syncephalis plumigaleata]|nr:hypothetical protein BDF22DRAFT_654646 [Syncephalis plumigaleata]
MTQQWSELLDSMVQSSERVAKVEMGNHNILNRLYLATRLDHGQITRLRSKAPSENEQNVGKLLDAVMALMEFDDKLQEREMQQVEKEKRKQDESMAEDDESKQIEDAMKREQNSIKELERKWQEITRRSSR